MKNMSMNKVMELRSMKNDSVVLNKQIVKLERDLHNSTLSEISGIKQSEFYRYMEVQESGKYNMAMERGRVAEATGLTWKQCRIIEANYSVFWNAWRCE